MIFAQYLPREAAPGASEPRAVSRAAAIIPAAGRGARIGFKTPKTFIDLGGEPLLARTIAIVAACRRIALIQPVLPRTHLAHFRSRHPRPFRLAHLPARPSPGGASGRTRSAAGLRALPEEIEIRRRSTTAPSPFVTTGLVERVLAQARRHGAALAARPGPRHRQAGVARPFSRRDRRPPRRSGSRRPPRPSRSGCCGRLTRRPAPPASRPPTTPRSWRRSVTRCAWSRARG